MKDWVTFLGEMYIFTEEEKMSNFMSNLEILSR